MSDDMRMTLVSCSNEQCRFLMTTNIESTCGCKFLHIDTDGKCRMYEKVGKLP